MEISIPERDKIDGNAAEPKKPGYGRGLIILVIAVAVMIAVAGFWIFVMPALR